MHSEQIKVLTNNLTRLLRRGAIRQVNNIIKKTHMADLAIVFKDLIPDNREKMFLLMKDPEDIGLFFSSMDESFFPEWVKKLDVDRLAEVFNLMPSDDAAYLLNILDDEFSDQILSKMQKEESKHIEQLMSYSENTAGSLMVKDFVALEENLKSKEVIEALQSKYLDVEMPFYIYVVDSNNRLVGVSSLRQLVVVHPDKPLKDFMAKDLISVTPYTDREEVAQLVSKYDYLAVPVVDEEKRILGIVTVDDVIDILHESATEDILKMAGVGEDYIETKTIFKGIRIRLPWLLASFVGGVMAFFVISHFEASIAKVSVLAAFIPVIAGMGGNIGTQSSIIVVRGLATNQILLKDFVRIVLKEFLIGLSLGLIYGIFIGIIAEIIFHAQIFSIPLALSVSSAIIISMSLAGLMGSMTPLCLHRMNIDPAVATGPFVTTTVDIFSSLCYFSLASYFMGL